MFGGQRVWIPKSGECLAGAVPIGTENRQIAEGGANAARFGLSPGRGVRHLENPRHAFSLPQTELPHKRTRGSLAITMDKGALFAFGKVG